MLLHHDQRRRDAFQRAEIVEAGVGDGDADPARLGRRSRRRNFPNYAAGPQGPAEADQPLARDGRTWRPLRRTAGRRGATGGHAPAWSMSSRRSSRRGELRALAGTEALARGGRRSSSPDTHARGAAWNDSSWPCQAARPRPASTRTGPQAARRHRQDPVAQDSRSGETSRRSAGRSRQQLLAAEPGPLPRKPPISKRCSTGSGPGAEPGLVSRLYEQEDQSVLQAAGLSVLRPPCSAWPRAGWRYRRRPGARPSPGTWSSLRR